MTFQNCSFINNGYIESVIRIDSLEYSDIVKESLGVQPKMLLYITGCIFQSNSTEFIQFSSQLQETAVLIIEQTSFTTSFELTMHAIVLSNVKLILKGPVIFSEISMPCLLKTNFEIIFYSYTEFSNIKASNLICGSAYFHLKIMENAYIKIKDNNISEYLFSIESDVHSLYQFCYLQFYRDKNTNN